MPWVVPLEGVAKRLDKHGERYDKLFQELKDEIAVLRGGYWDIMLWRAKFAGVLIAGNMVGGVLTAILIAWLTRGFK